MPNPIDITRSTAQRKFTDREEPQKAFRLMLEKRQRYRVLHYYGVGGIGKSALQRHLMGDTHLEGMANTIYAQVDFDTPRLRDSAEALRVLSRRLQNDFEVNFPLFEAGFAVYWSVSNPDMKLDDDRKLPFIEEGSILGGFVGFLDGGVTSVLISAIDYIYQKFPKQIDKAYLEDLKKLPSFSMEHIKKRLSLYFTEDLKQHIAKKSIADCVILLDTYEALQGKRWVEEELASNLPQEAMLLTCGREKLRWEERDSGWGAYIEQHLVGNLSKEDCRIFLEECGIGQADLVDAIVEASQGVPYYLDLCVDIYEKIPNPAVEDFSVDQTRLFERFVKYQSQQAKETLKVLAQGRYYTREIFEKLVERFKTAYPITAFEEFNRYSFISKDGNRYTLHDLMRESLIEVTSDDLKKEIQTYLLEYYEKVFSELKLEDLKLLESESLKEALEEAYYLKGLLLSHTERSLWLNGYFELFCDGAKYSVIFDLLKEDTEGFSQEGDEVSKSALATSYNNLAGLYDSMGEYEKALPLYQKSLKIREEVLGEMHPDTAASYNNLALLYKTMGEYEKALPLYQKSLKIREEVLGEMHPSTATSYNNLAGLYRSMGEYEKALPLYQKSLKICQEVLGEMHPDTATSYNNLAGLYYSMGEYEKALPLYQKSLKICQEVLGEMHPSTATSYNDLALLYRSMGEYEKALPLYQKSLKIYQEVLGEMHPYTATSYNNLAGLYKTMGEYEKALPLYQKDLKICQEVLGEMHPDTATSYNNLALLLYYNTDDYHKAYEYMQKAVEIREKTLPAEHPDLANSKRSLAMIKEKLGLG